MKTEVAIVLGVGAVATLTLIIASRAGAAAPQIMLKRDDLLLVTPEHDADMNALKWAAFAIRKTANSIGATPYNGIATAENVREAILGSTPPRFYGLGHGNTNIYTVENMEPFWRADGLNLDLVVGKTIHLMSCLAGRQLGPAIIAVGARAFFGYLEEFTAWVVGDTPVDCPYNMASYAGDMEVELQFEGGVVDLKAIYDAVIDRCNAEIAFWESQHDTMPCAGIPITDALAANQINSIINNRDSLVVYYPGGQYGPRAPVPF